MAAIGRSNADPLIVQALATGSTISDAARQAGVSERTARRRARRPDIVAAVSSAQRGGLALAVERLAAASVGSVETLVLLQGESTPPPSRVAACRAVLDFAIRTAEHVELVQRVAAIEQALGLAGTGDA